MKLAYCHSWTGTSLQSRLVQRTGSLVICIKGATSRFGHLEKFVVLNPCQASPSLTIFCPLWFIIISLVFFYLSIPLFSDFLQFKVNFVRGSTNQLKIPWLSSFEQEKRRCLSVIVWYSQHERAVKISDFFNCAGFGSLKGLWVRRGTSSHKIVTTSSDW